MKWRFGKGAIGLGLGLVVAALATPVIQPVAAQRGAARPQVLMPDGPVRPVLRKNCTACHGIDDYAYFALDKAGWQNLIATKHKLNGGDANLSEQDRSLVLDFLVSKFGPATKPFPRSYIPPEITTFFSDPEAKRIIDRACISCHPQDRIEAGRYPATKWRVLILEMREKGATITDDEIEQLTEWLGRTHGPPQDQ